MSYKDAVIKGISLGGDSDTIWCIAGGITKVFYKEIPTEIILKASNPFIFNRLFGNVIYQVR